ncbi:protein kinase [bacterium]|nr:protein kinase [bacterium]
MHEPRELEQGELLGQHRLIERLGRGAMAEVWLAEVRAPTARDGERVALKIPRRPSFIRHLRREGVLLSEVHHANVARMIGADLEADPPHLAMELVIGQPLRALCRGTIKPREATLLGDQILAGLGAIHRAGIVHLDLKPENVIVQPDGVAKIVDLGLGRAVTSLMAEVYLSASLASRELPLGGTLAYMAPEQRKGKPCDGRADLFAFGVLLHELLSGRLPGPDTRLTRIRKDLTPRWDVLIAKLTHPHPERRPQTADEARHLVAFTLAEKLTMPTSEGGVEPRELLSFDQEALEWVSPWTAGMVVGEHELVSLLGRGGFGEVWKARKHETLVALKLALREDAHAALAIEAAAAARVEHAGIPRVLADNTNADPPHVVFELVSGTSLRLRINDEGLIPLEEALETFLAMCDVVLACHAAGVVHRDLKPEHFLIGLPDDPPDSLRGFPRPGPPRVSLIDFGLAALVEPASMRASVASTADVRGTYDYMAPEQRKGIAGDEKVDVYALGVCLFEMISDDLPRGAARLKSLRTEVPDAIDALVLKMMREDPRDRCSLAEARRTLREIVGGRATAERSRRARTIYVDLGALLGRAWSALVRSELIRSKPFIVLFVLLTLIAISRLAMLGTYVESSRRRVPESAPARTLEEPAPVSTGEKR